MDHEEEIALAFLRGCTTTFELFDNLRSSYGYLVPDCAAGLLGYLFGYGQGARLAHETFNEEMQTYVESFLGVSGERWPALIERHAKYRHSEIPTIYAAADFGRKAIYRNALSCILPKHSRELWNREQERALGTEGRPAPQRIVLAEGQRGMWHLFFYDENDIRFDEVVRSVKEALSRWASTAFELDSLDWVKEDPGMFNIAPAELSR